MAQAFTATVKTEIPSMTYTNTVDNQTVGSTLNASTIPKTRSQAYTDGSTANKAQQIWTDNRTLTTTTTETLDLTALAGGAFGTINFSKIKEILIQISTATAGYRLLVGGGATNPFTAFLDSVTAKKYIGASGQWHDSNPVDGYTVDGANKILSIENPSGGSITYTITIIGVGTNA